MTASRIEIRRIPAVSLAIGGAVHECAVAALANMRVTLIRLLRIPWLCMNL